MATAFGLLGYLAQKVLAARELAIQLIVQIVAVSDDHNGGAFQRLLQIMGIEHHGQGLAAALGMPEHAALTVGDGGIFGGFHGLFHREILVIPRQNFEGVGPVHIEADKVLEDVQKTLFLKDTLKKGVELGGLGVLVAAILGFPLHEAVLAGGDGTSFGGGQVTHNTNLVVNKQGRDFVHIVAQLPVSGGGISLFARRRLQLHHHQRQAVDK